MTRGRSSITIEPRSPENVTRLSIELERNLAPINSRVINHRYLPLRFDCRSRRNIAFDDTYSPRFYPHASQSVSTSAVKMEASAKLRDSLEKYEWKGSISSCSKRYVSHCRINYSIVDRLLGEFTLGYLLRIIGPATRSYLSPPCLSLSFILINIPSVVAMYTVLSAHINSKMPKSTVVIDGYGRKIDFPNIL